MPFVDDPDNKTDDMGTAGANPLSQGAGQAQGSYDAAADANQSASAGSGAITGQSVDQATSSGGTTNKKAPKASSGMFNNIQNYVNKNKPQAQKMSGAVTQDFSKQAGEIRQAAQEKKNQQDNLIKTNTGLIDTAKGQAGAAVNQIMGTQAENPQYEAATADQFKNLRENNVTGVQQVGDLNLGRQQMRTDALSKLAQGSNTEEGRRNLLGSTFQKQGEYSRGMSGLDNLITSGDKGARENLVQGTKDVAGDLKGKLGEFSQQGRDAKNAQDLLIGGAGDYAKNLLYGETGAIDTTRAGIDNPYDQAIKDYGRVKGNMTESFGAGGDYALSQEDMDALGMTEGMNLYGMDPSTYLNSQPTQAAYASGQDINRLDALAKLAGNDMNKYGITAEQAEAQDSTGGLLGSDFAANLASAKAAWEPKEARMNLVGQKLEARQAVTDELQSVRQMINDNVHSNLGSVKDLQDIESSYQYRNMYGSEKDKIDAALDRIRGMDQGFITQDGGGANFSVAPQQSEYDDLQRQKALQRILKLKS